MVLLLEEEDLKAPFGTWTRVSVFPSPLLHLLMERQNHVREAGELEQNEEDELAGEVLPQELTGATVIELLLRLGPLHGVHHQIHQLVLQNRTSLLMLQEGRTVDRSALLHRPEPLQTHQ